jgi:ATP-dependent DNA helicase RecQ
MDSVQPLIDAMQRYWGYDRFLPLQREAMLCSVQRRDAVVVLPTGGGKSLCYQVPAVCRDGLTLVVSPLISLMKDQVDALEACGVPAACVNSTLSPGERKQIAERVTAGELKLLYMAPERLLAGRTLDFLADSNLCAAAIDEAHCISAWGHDFRPEYRGLRILKQRFPNIGVQAFTATASDQVRRDIAEQLELSEPEFLVGSFDRPNLIYKVQRASNRFGQVCEVVERHRGESGIVYCISRKEVDKTAAALAALGHQALPYHAGLADDERHRNQNAFIREEVHTIVATVAFGMGIDKSNVRYVVHCGMPKSLEHYQQESGRAGRDGLEAECQLIFSGGDFITWSRMLTEGDAVARAGAQRALQAMQDYCQSALCRHRALVEYFGQELGGDNCGACDVCLGELDVIEDSLVTAQKIISCVVRLEERFGGDYTAKVLSGSKEARILEFGHDRLSTYGLLSDQSIRTIRDWLEQLVAQGFLIKTGEFNTLSVTESGWQVLRGKAEPQLLQPAEQRPSTRSAAPDNWDGVDRELFELLRTRRKQLADERNVPAYVVFSDATLRDLARQRPTTRERMRGVRGVGDKKLADFGEPFLAVISDYCQQHSLASDLAPAPVAAPVQSTSEARPINASSIAAFSLFREGLSLAEVATRMGRAPATVNGYLADYLRHERVTDPSPWVEPTIVARIEEAAGEVGSERLKPVFELLGGDVDYDAIRVVLTCLRNRAPATAE